MLERKSRVDRMLTIACFSVGIPAVIAWLWVFGDFFFLNDLAANRAVRAFQSGKLVGLTLTEVEARYGSSDPGSPEGIRIIFLGTQGIGGICIGSLELAPDGVTVIETDGWCD